MGVTLVSQMPVAEGKNVQQPVELLTRKLELLGAKKQGTFCVDCETYHTVAENDPCLIADTNFDVLKGFFQNAKADKIETRGTRYQHCDFLVKMGTVTTQR